MKNSRIELHQMCLTELNDFELTTIEGGSFWGWVEAIGLGVLAVGLAIGTGGLALVAAGTASVITEAGAALFLAGYLGTTVGEG